MLPLLDHQPITLTPETLSMFLYHYGVYTSFQVIDHSAKGLGFHLERLSYDAEHFLGIKIKTDEIMHSVNLFCNQITVNQQVTCRITIFPKDLNLALPHQLTSYHVLVTGRIGNFVSSSSPNLKTYSCSRSFTQHKITNISAAIKTRSLAKQVGYDDALFINDKGHITEGPTWNIFFIQHNEIFTPPLSCGLLAGVTRKIICHHLGYKVHENIITCDILNSYQACFITNAAIGAVPVSSIDDTDFDCDNPWIQKITNAYQAYKPETIQSFLK